jgi:hypothetical protein
MEDPREDLFTEGILTHGGPCRASVEPAPARFEPPPAPGRDSADPPASPESMLSLHAAVRPAPGAPIRCPRQRACRPRCGTTRNARPRAQRASASRRRTKRCLSVVLPEQFSRPYRRSSSGFTPTVVLVKWPSDGRPGSAQAGPGRCVTWRPSASRYFTRVAHRACAEPTRRDR